MRSSSWFGSLFSEKGEKKSLLNGINKSINNDLVIDDAEQPFSSENDGAFQYLPNEIIDNIISYFSLRDAAHFTQTNRRLHAITETAILKNILEITVHHNNASDNEIETSEKEIIAEKKVEGKKEEITLENKEEQQPITQVNAKYYGAIRIELNEVVLKEKQLNQIVASSIYKFFKAHPVVALAVPTLTLTSSLGFGLSLALWSLSKFLGASEEEAADVRFFASLPLVLAGFSLGSLITYKHYQKTKRAAALNEEIENNPITPLLRK